MEKKMGMTKKKLLIASDCFLPRWDGIARFLAELIPKIKDDYEITVVAPDFNGSRINIPGVRIVRIPVHKFTWGDFPPAKFKFRIIKKLVRENDIVFSQSIGPVGALAIIYAKRFKKPIISFIHSIEWELVPKSASRFMFFMSNVVKGIARWLYNKTSLLLVPSDDTCSHLRQAGIKTPMETVHLGVDTKKFSPAQSKEEAKKKATINPDFIIIGFSGRVGREKDLGTLYRAFSVVRKKHENARLLIVGKGLELKNIFDSMDDVIHIPISNNVQDYLRAMDIFVLPSLTETSSLATMEAMACGLPVIATDVGHLKNYIDDSKNGYMFPKKDYEILANKLEKLIVNESLRKGIGLMARKTIETKYPWEKTVKEIKRCLDKVQ